MDSLPDEILLLCILRRLPGVQVARLARVCRRWERVCRDARAFSELTVNAVGLAGVQILAAAIPHCEALEELRVPCRRALSELQAPLPCSPSLKSLTVDARGMGKECPVLDHARLMWPNLVRLVLFGGPYWIHSLRPCLGEGLRILHLLVTPVETGFTKIVVGPSIDIGDVFPALPSSLRELVVSGFDYKWDVSVGLSVLAKRCPRLEALELGDIYDRAEGMAAYVIHHMPQLSRLALREGVLAHTTLAAIFSAHQNLRSFDLTTAINYKGNERRRKEAPLALRKGPTPRRLWIDAEVSRVRELVALWTPRAKDVAFVQVNPRRKDGGGLQVRTGRLVLGS
mgnify:CR=1 FL=1